MTALDPNTYHPVTRTVAAYGLPGTRLAFPDDPLDAAPWSRVVREVRAQRLTGFLVESITDGAFAVTDEQWDEAAADHLAAIDQCLQLERLLIAVSDLWASAGISHRVLKGPALGRLLYADPSLRTYGDIDLLVPSESIDAATRLLNQAGFRREAPEPRPGFDRRFGKGSTFIAADGHEIDLHRTFASGPFGIRIPLDDLFSASAPFELGGRRLEGLDPLTRTLNQCYHAALNGVPPRLQPLRDVAQHVLVGGVQADDLRALATRWHGRAVLVRAIRWSWETLELDPAHPLAAWADRVDLRPTEVRGLEGRTTLERAVASIWAVPGVSGKIAYIRALALPDGEFLAARQQDRFGRWKKALRARGFLAGG